LREFEVSQPVIQPSGKQAFPKRIIHENIADELSAIVCGAGGGGGDRGEYDIECQSCATTRRGNATAEVGEPRKYTPMRCRPVAINGLRVDVEGIKHGT
jgi:hypothetical protein